MFKVIGAVFMLSYSDTNYQKPGSKIVTSYHNSIKVQMKGFKFFQISIESTDYTNYLRRDLVKKFLLSGVLIFIWYVTHYQTIYEIWVKEGNR